MVFIRKYRRQICEIGRRLYDDGFVVANDGNISVRLPDQRVMITPTNVSKGRLSARRMSVIDFQGNLLKGDPPSSEYRMHLEIYNQRPDVQAVVHAHPPCATAWGLTGQSLEQDVLPEVIVTLGRVPVVAYQHPSTAGFAGAVGKSAREHEALLLQNHGAVTYAGDLQSACDMMERLEHVCKILFYAQSLGNIQILPAEQVRELLEIFPVSERVRRQFK